MTTVNDNKPPTSEPYPIANMEPGDEVLLDMLIDSMSTLHSLEDDIRSTREKLETVSNSYFRRWLDTKSGVELDMAKGALVSEKGAVQSIRKSSATPGIRCFDLGETNR